MKYKFKKGDKVKRINCEGCFISIGDTGVVMEDCFTDNGKSGLSIKIDKNGYTEPYDVMNFEKIEEPKITTCKATPCHNSNFYEIQKCSKCQAVRVWKTYCCNNITTKTVISIKGIKCKHCWKIDKK